VPTVSRLCGQARSFSQPSSQPTKGPSSQPPRSLAVNDVTAVLHAQWQPSTRLRISLVRDHLRSHGSANESAVCVAKHAAFFAAIESTYEGSVVTAFRAPSGQPTITAVCTAQWPTEYAAFDQPSAGPSSQPTECHESAVCVAKHAAFSQPSINLRRGRRHSLPRSLAVTTSRRCTAQWPTEYAAFRISLVGHLAAHGVQRVSRLCGQARSLLRSHRVNLRRVRRHSLPRRLAVNRRHSRLHSPVANEYAAFESA